jgi:serine/threonine protein kinase
VEGIKPGASVTRTIRLVRPLGAGGMGSVWIADHLALRTQVVVKFMATELTASADALERFGREAAAAAQVKSPHVVQMLDHGVTPEGIPFIAMELLEGRDLSKHLLQRGRLSMIETAEIVAQVAKALTRAHERGIVHRDIKPENLFLCDVGGTELFVKILDFGIAKGGGANALSGGTRTGAMIGTPYYMSPEQMMGSRHLDPRADLWALGVVVYQCVLGQRPFDAETVGALAVMIHSGELPRPSFVDPTIPRPFDDWFARACARNPEARFATAKELADGLVAVARGEPWIPPVLATTPLRPQPTDPNRSTHGVMGLASGTQPSQSSKASVVWLSMGAGALILAVAVGGLWLARRPPAAVHAPPIAAAAEVPAPPASPGPVALPPPVVLEPPPSAATVPDPPPPSASSSAPRAPFPPPALLPFPAGPSKKMTPHPAVPKNEKDIF